MATVIVNLRFWYCFWATVKAPTVLNHSKFTLRICLRLGPSLNKSFNASPLNFEMEMELHYTIIFTLWSFCI